MGKVKALWQEEKEAKEKHGINSLGKVLEGILKDVEKMQSSQDRIINISNHNYDYTYEHLENPDGTKEWHLKNLDGDK
jgi:hypothetical protein|tara:strand:+ start:307 stop:540 length:234 start_codon:yes stop_codon:yes gene_type:complete